MKGGLKVSPETVVWNYGIFDNNFGIKNDFTKYLKESSWSCPDQDFSIKYISIYALVCKISSQLLALNNG